MSKSYGAKGFEKAWKKQLEGFNETKLFFSHERLQTVIKYIKGDKLLGVLMYRGQYEIDNWLKKGHPVIVNVSRTIIDEARNEYMNLKVIFIEVPFEITVQRIKERGIESEKLLKERIERAKTHQKLPEADFLVDNSGNLKDAIDQFLNYLINKKI